MTQSRQYLSKGRFKLALECPAKLYFVGKREYADTRQDDEFLKSLAEGGYQVGELAKLMHPGGVEVITRGYDNQVQETEALLTQESVTVFEGALRHERLFVRVDILVKSGNQIKLIEVKSKSYDPTDSNFFRNTKGRIASALRPYLLDVAFQTYVARKALPSIEITPYLMLPDKSRVATVSGLNQMFPITRLDGEQRQVISRPRPGPSLADVGEPLLSAIDVSEYVEELLSSVLEPPGAAGTLADLADRWAQIYEADQRIDPPIQAQCKHCEFRATPGDQLRSGIDECWSRALDMSLEELARPWVLDLWDGRRTEKWIAARKFFLSELNKDDIGYKEEGPGLSRTQRQWIQISKAGLQGNHLFLFDVAKSAMQGWRFPLNMIDFETSRTALPFHQGSRPYELIAFQFSHHVVYEDGSVKHGGEYLCTRPGEFPNLGFLRALRDALTGNQGTVFMWSPYEQTVLKSLIDQIERIANQTADAASLVAFAKSLTVTRDEGGRVIHQGERAMVDLCELASSTFFHSETKGSNSIKRVLPAMLRASDFLRDKYSQPIYGGGRPNSRNFTDAMQWWQVDQDGLPIDPYRLLPPVFSDLTLLEDKDDPTLLNQGGAATVAYARLQAEDISPQERKAWEAALLKYCELDTLAMVMVVEGWRDWVWRGESGET